MNGVSKLSASQKADCKTDLLEFSKTMFQARNGAEFIVNWHHEKICETLEQVLLGKIKRLIINLPPRYGKTELVVTNFIAWAMGIFPASQFIHATYSKRLASHNSWNIRALIEHETYREIFPTVRLRIDSKAKDEWRTTLGGVMYATGSEGTITGYGAGDMSEGFGGAIVIDDPHKASEANSAIVRESVIDWFSTTMESRTNSPDTPIILNMQRLHVQDLAGFLIDGGNGEDWHLLTLPAENDKGEPLWEFKHTKKDLERLESSNAYVYSAQYMQAPSPKGGGIFKDDWWKFYKVAPNVEFKIITADTAQKVKVHNDYSVFQCWGFLDNNIYLLDQIRGKWESPELRLQFKSFWNKHVGNPGQTIGNLRAAYIEDKASGTGLIQDIRASEGIPIVAVPRNVDKLCRAMDMCHYIASGYVYLPEDAQWLNAYLSEFGSFTPLMTHLHDDQIDPTLDAIDILLRPPAASSGTW